MHPIKIIPHCSNTTYHQPHFFIQSKGYSAGRPSSSPYNNSHVVLVNDELEKGMLFWICFALWKSNSFMPLLNSKPLPELPPASASGLIATTCKRLSDNPDGFISNVKELKELVQTEKLLGMQLKMIKALKKEVSRKLLR